MAGELNSVTTKAEAQDGMIFLTGEALPLSMSIEGALVFAGRLIEAASIAVGHRARPTREPGTEWV